MTMETSAIDAAYRLLEASVIHYQGQPVGTIASSDPRAPAANYRDCFIRDFVPSGLVYLLDGETRIVRNFLRLVLSLRGRMDLTAAQHSPPGILPASFKVVTLPDGREELHADFGDRAIGRVAPVDSMMWWLLLLRAYVRATGDTELLYSTECQRCIRQIMSLMLQGRFEMFPTLLVPDGSFMIDRRMGVYGHPLEIQALFYGALQALPELLPAVADNQWILDLASRREEVLADYVRHYYWLDLKRLNEIHRYQTELFGHEIENVLNIYPESIPDWLPDWLPDDSGYLVGNLGPGRMDFRFFAMGNLLAVIFGLATPEQSRRILLTYERRWDDLVGRMPVKICFPAMEGKEWHLMTGSDPKNRPWSYHNGGNWPVLLWPFMAAAQHNERRGLALRAYELAAWQLFGDEWPEYYDGRHGRLIGRRANFNQVWSATALILADKLLKNPAALQELGFHAHERGTP